MRSTIPALVLALLFSAPAHAGPKKLLKDWKFVAGEVVIATALSLDGASTCRGMSWGYREAGPIGNGSQSCGATIGKMAGAFAYYSAIHIFERHYAYDTEHKWFKVIGYTMVPTAVAAAHGSAAAHNYSLPKPRPANAQSPILVQ